jgi:hypothetical protein
MDFLCEGGGVSRRTHTNEFIGKSIFAQSACGRRLTEYIVAGYMKGVG